MTICPSRFLNCFFLFSWIRLDHRFQYYLTSYTGMYSEIYQVFSFPLPIFCLPRILNQAIFVGRGFVGTLNIFCICYHHFLPTDSERFSPFNCQRISEFPLDFILIYDQQTISHLFRFTKTVSLLHQPADHTLPLFPST